MMKCYLRVFCYLLPRAVARGLPGAAGQPRAAARAEGGFAAPKKRGGLDACGGRRERGAAAGAPRLISFKRPMAPGAGAKVGFVGLSAGVGQAGRTGGAGRSRC